MIHELLKVWRKETTDLFFPEFLTCERCGRDLVEPVRFCQTCLNDAIVSNSSLCSVCGRALNAEDSAYQNYFGKCKQCQETFYFFKAHRSFMPYDQIAKKMLLGIKYRGELQYVGAVVEGLLAAYHSFGISIDPDLVVPVPIHKTRRLIRGFNQSEIYAKALCEKLGLQYADVLYRDKATKKLRNLGKFARKSVLVDAIILKNNNYFSVKGKKILLIDDIFTTGETLNTSAKALYEAGAEVVYAITYAMGI